MINKVKTGLGITAIALILIGGGYYYSKGQKLSQNKNATAQKNVPQELDKVVAEVGKLIDLPTNETPTLATVTDISKLKGQPFFQKAKDGDKVLIYANNKKAILYDPVLKKVMDIAAINTSTPAAQPAQPRIVIRNGTKTVGLTNKIETKIKKVISEANIADKENAARSDYLETTVVVLNDSAKETASALAKTLSAQIGDLPKDETKPKDVDIIIIAGKDQV